MERGRSHDDRPAKLGFLGALLLLALVEGDAARLWAGQLPNPTITAQATPYNASYAAANLFDASATSEFASQSRGPCSAPLNNNGTYVELDFGSTVTFDRFILVTRNNTADNVLNNRLYVGNSASHALSDTILAFSTAGNNGQGIIQKFNAVSGRYVRWEVLTGPPTGNLGGNQMYFLITPGGMTPLAAPAVINSSPPYNANYAAAKAVDGYAGYGNNDGSYASAGTGAGMFIDFDFGVPVAIAGWDFLNRPQDMVTAYNLIFSGVSDFSTGSTTNSYAANASGLIWNTVTNAVPITARYVRLQATASVGVNTGVREIQFYTPQGQPPLVTQPPQGGLRLVGDAITFNVVAGGDSPLRFQWWTATTPLTGATNQSLTLTNLLESDSGSYRVVVTNAYGSVTSAPAVLVVTNPPVDIASDLRLWLKLDETAGLAAVDDSGYANDGTLQGFAGDDSQWMAGRLDGGLRFNTSGSGSNEVVLVQDYGALDFSAGSEFTLAVWVKAPAGQEDSAGLIAKGGGGGGESYALDVFQGRYRLFVRGADAGTFAAAQGADGPNLAWQHLVAVYSRTLNRMKLYVNMTEVASATPIATNLLSNAHDVSVGSRQLGTNEYNLNFNGLLDDVRIYARALTPSDVAALYRLATPQAPAIAQQPRGFIVPQGGAWTFSAVTDGTVPFSHQWLRNGAPIAGATNAAFSVTNAQLADNAAYSLVVTNLYGTNTSAPARLDVVPFLDLRAAPAQASSQWPGGGYPPQNAFDGLRFSTGPMTVRWASASQGTPQWIYVDLGRDLQLAHVLLDWENAAGRDIKFRVRTEAEGPTANPADWTEVASVSGYAQTGNGVDGADVVLDFLQARVVLQGNINTAPAPTATITSGGVTARYLMVDCLALTSPHGHFSLWEFQVNAVADLSQASLQMVNGQPNLLFAAVPGYTYTIQRTASLSPSAWTNLGIVTADALGRVTFVDTNPPPARAFYRTVYP